LNLPGLTLFDRGGNDIYFFAFSKKKERGTLFNTKIHKKEITK